MRRTKTRLDFYPRSLTGFVIHSKNAKNELNFYAQTKMSGNKRTSYWSEDFHNGKVYKSRKVAQNMIDKLCERGKQKLEVVDVESLVKTGYYFCTDYNKVMSEEFYPSEINNENLIFDNEKDALFNELIALRRNQSELKLSLMELGKEEKIVEAMLKKLKSFEAGD